MPLDELQLDLINNHKRQNQCFVSGLMESGKEGCAEDWLTDDQVENMCGRPHGIFTQVTQITLRTRYLTSEEETNNPHLRVITGPFVKEPVITIQ